MSGRLVALGPGDLFTLPWWLGVPLVVYWVVVVVLLVMDDREPSSTLTWLFILVFLPIVGLVVFLFFGRDWKVITARRPWAARLRAIVDARMRPIYERNAAADERFREEFRDTQAYGVARTIARRAASGSSRQRRWRSSPREPRSSTGLPEDSRPRRSSIHWRTSSGSRTSSRRAHRRPARAAEGRRRGAHHERLHRLRPVQARTSSRA